MKRPAVSLVSSDGDIDDSVIDQNPEICWTGAPLVREESTVEKSAMATLAAKEQADSLKGQTKKKN